MYNQQTVRQTVSFTGQGLHSGQEAVLKICPAPVGHGLKVQRTDLPGKPLIPVSYQYVSPSALCTTLSHDGATVGTIEHVLAALMAANIDNAILKLNAPEMPILDGSAAPFLAGINKVGVIKQRAPKQYIRVLQTVRVQDGDKWAQLDPADHFSLDVHIDFTAPAIGRQQVAYTLDMDSFADTIAQARTFCQRQDIDAMRNIGLAKGGHLGNAVVVDGSKILNQGGWRMANECAKHKLLDAVGDMALASKPLLAAYTSSKSGHYLNYRLVEALMEDEAAWEISTQATPTRAPQHITEVAVYA